MEGQLTAGTSSEPRQTGMLSGLGVRTRLSLAFFAVCAFGVLGAAAAFYSFREFDDALGLITKQRTPAALKSQELARHAERIVDAAPALLTVTSQVEKNRRIEEITGEEGALYDRLADLKAAGVDSAVVEGLETDVKRLNANLTALDALMNNRIRIGERKRQVLTDAVQAAAAVQQLLVPWSAVMEQAIAQWRRSKFDDTLPLARRAEADAEFEKSLAWFQALQASQVAASNVSDLLQRAAAADAESGVRVAGFRLQQALNELERLSGDFDPRLRMLLVEALANLRPFAVGDSSVPALRQREISLIAEGQKLLSENAALSKSLTAKVANLTLAASRDITEANSKATSVLQFSTWVLVAAVTLSLVSSLLIGWLYVGRNVVARLTTLSGGMRAIVDGRRDIVVPSGGGDEIAEMARAVEVFRDNAIALDQLLAEQEQAAVQLEQKVEQRTHELSQSVSELRALGEVTQAVTSTLDLQTVLTTIVAKASQLSGTECGAIYVLDEASGEFQMRATYGMSDELIASLRDSHSALSSAVGGLAEYRAPVQTADLQNERPSLVNDIILKAGYRSRLLVPLIHSDKTMGALVVRRREPGEFPRQTVDLLRTFAAQSALAIQNARLFHEIEEKGQQLEQASQHKSQFLANMSHELRTPLNAIIGVTEMLQEDARDLNRGDEIEPLDRVVRAARHLLALINDILDLSKIEAGKMELHLEEFGIASLIDDVVKTMETLAAKGNNKVIVDCPPHIGAMQADQTRVRQALLNLVSNANKFTESGTVTIRARRQQQSGRDWITIAVDDTGIGMTPQQMGKLFQQFSQANLGPSAAENVVVTDELPDDVDFVSATASVGTFTAVNGTITWNLGTVAVVDPVRTLTITVEVHPDAVDPLVNNAAVTSTTSDPNTANNLATWTVGLDPEANLTLTKDDSPDPVTAGSDLTYTLTVGNAGPSTAQDVVVTDTIPDETTFVSAVGGTGSTVCAQVQIGVVSCEVGDLDPGESETIFITVHVAADTPDGTITNEAEATSPTDPDGAQASEDTTVVTKADLWMEKKGTVPAANPAGALIYTLTVHNHPGSAPDDTPTSGAGGPSDAQNVVVSDPLPLTNKKLKVQFLTPGCSYSLGSHTVTCNASTVPFGTSVVFEIQVQVQGSNGTLMNTATVSSATTDPVAGNNRDTTNNVVKGGTGKGSKP